MMKEQVFEAAGMPRASTAPGIERFLRRQRGVDRADASYMSGGLYAVTGGQPII